MGGTRLRSRALTLNDNREAFVDNQRNMILAVLLTALVLFGWDAGIRYLYPHADKPKPVAAASPGPAAQASGAAATPGTDVSMSAASAGPRDLKTALASGGRVPIAGTRPLRLDQCRWRRDRRSHHQPPQFGGQEGQRPGSHFLASRNPRAALCAIWLGRTGHRTAQRGEPVVRARRRKLTQQTPVTFTWANATGQTFTIRYAIDADYMITATQTLTNGGSAPVVVKAIAQIDRTNANADISTFNVHSGPVGSFNQTVDFGSDYDDVEEAQIVKPLGKPDWIGFTDIYWMSTLIPDKADTAGDYRAMGKGIYLANLYYPESVVAQGQKASHTTRLFAGGKENDVLERYEEGGIPRFSLAIDWGWFRWFEKPILMLLKKLFELTSNFGVAIILLTFIVRGLMFPIAQRQFASLAAMKAIQPKMKEIQDRWKDDKQKQQQEIMALYKKEGVNPLGGCLPILLQIPIFFALYKVLILAIEMRHQPFVGWIKDLSAQDPAHILNLFGLLPFTPPSFLGIGLLAVLLGITMHLQFKLNPAQPDPIQQQVFAIMPWMMMFIMAPFAAGLLIYWITSNILTIAQQKYLYSRHPQLAAQTDKDETQPRAGQA